MGGQTPRLTPTRSARTVMLAVQLLWFVLSNVCYKASQAAFAGPYHLTVHKFEECPKEELKVLNISRRDLYAESKFRYNHTIKSPVMDINMKLSNRVFTRGESTMSLDVARWNSVSGWRDHFLVMSLGELCFVYEEIVTDIIKYVTEKIGIRTKCPIADGIYSSQNCAVQLASLRHFPSLPYGRYRVQVLIGYKKSLNPKEYKSCLRVMADLVPKTSEAKKP